ncbi:cysteine hydrolase family protein [Frankia sp. AgKG'84/4]|uniref:cysteine hydrolase family protein n=1 Tax=Frankia sp. AgKG'84/4 TaxID=573490 RepID=UPI00200C3CFF|nr:cysteine hydrolase [Frankia sp. AgKG'84/4]
MPGNWRGEATALVLVDLQHWIVDMPWAPISGTQVVDACARLRTGLTETTAKTVIVRYLRADGRDGGPQAAPNQLVAALAPQPGDLLVTKDGLDAFAGTSLAELLREQGRTSLVIAGLSTAHGVSATAGTAVASGFDVTVVSDATASVTMAEHTRALDELARAGAAICSLADVLVP